ncbi:MAG: peptidylprolyl isomerase [Proteobacteria bacterium]|nr:peptidylprolyl isomerase [Pseudomonadota bacterium]MBU1715365.1 peptidylprolyl isomerase [Pseudomonadota bacterium]
MVCCMITGAPSTQDIITALQGKAEAFFTKPFDFEKVLGQLKECLEKKRLKMSLASEKKTLEKTHRELEQLYHELQTTQAQVIQQEKLASIGNLAAGVAHEINNPMGFIASNLSTLGKYALKLTEFIEAQSSVLTSHQDREKIEDIQEKRKNLKIDYLLNDIPDLIAESLDGADRVKIIVQNLKSFARTDDQKPMLADLNACLESTLNIIWNELKYKCTVKKDYGDLPLVRCFPQQLNQVFMNLLLNAAQAIETQGEIIIQTFSDRSFVHVTITDTGCGIPTENLDKIFEPFFTTKKIGMGTGLGMSIAYDLIKKHNGKIAIQSEIGKGTTFTVSIPVQDESN